MFFTENTKGITKKMSFPTLSEHSQYELDNWPCQPHQNETNSYCKNSFFGIGLFVFISSSCENSKTSIYNIEYCYNRNKSHKIIHSILNKRCCISLGFDTSNVFWSLFKSPIEITFPFSRTVQWIFRIILEHIFY